MWPAIEVSGIGGPDLCWRHTATTEWPVRHGSHTGWFVLTVPRRVDEVTVEAHTWYETHPEDDLGVDLTPEAGQFIIRLPARPSDRTPGTDAELRVGFALDVVGYSERPVDGQRRAQERLAALVVHLVRALGPDEHAVATQTAGDSVIVFLPTGAPAAKVLPRLLRTAPEWLREDNGRSPDRLRLRMAVTVGPIEAAALGWPGQTPIELVRLLDSDAIRDVVRADPSVDLAVIISDTLHGLFVRPRYPGHDPDQFVAASAVVKGYGQTAWLWRPDLPAAARLDG
jgi:hypothetical protein